MGRCKLTLGKTEAKYLESKSGKVLKFIDDCIIRGNRRLLATDAYLLLEACRATKARNIVEIGSMDGGSSLVLGTYAKNNKGHLWCLEPKPRGKWYGNIKELGLEGSVTLVQGSSPWISSSEVGTPIDVLFIDGDHRTSHMITDYIFWEKYVKVGGIIVFHDYCGMKNVKEWVRDALRIILNDYDLYLTHPSEKNKLELFGKSEGSDRGAIAYRKVK
jgi:predicted O-methyltransferase YrrM